MTVLNDQRYTVTKEYTGNPEKKYVARFCGEWIASAETFNKAAFECIFHNIDRELTILKD